jgi:pimeloyl-ACP methyl ester carboxylesterase
VFVREVTGEGWPAVFSHGHPTHSGDSLPFLERMDGPAIALDLPGWGRSHRPSTRRFDYSFDCLAR